MRSLSTFLCCAVALSQVRKTAAPKPPPARQELDLLVASTVEPTIEDMRRKFESNPLVQHLASQEEGRVSSRAFLPYMTFFVNSFSDLNRMVLPYQDAGEDDKLKQAINEHCEEDSRHLYLLWKDLEHYSSAMAQAGVANFPDSVRFLWSDDLYDVRRLGYEVARLAGIAHKPLQRYAMIRVMEELGNIFFTTGVGLMIEDGVPSQYMSHDHLELENGHLQEHGHEHGLEDLFDNLSFENDNDRDVARSVMLSTFELFHDMTTCVYTNMVERSLEMPAASS